MNRKCNRIIICAIEMHARKSINCTRHNLKYDFVLQPPTIHLKCSTARPLFTKILSSAAVAAIRETRCTYPVQTDPTQRHVAVVVEQEHLTRLICVGGALWHISRTHLRTCASVSVTVVVVGVGTVILNRFLLLKRLLFRTLCLPQTLNAKRIGKSIKPIEHGVKKMWQYKMTIEINGCGFLQWFRVAFQIYNNRYRYRTRAGFIYRTYTEQREGREACLQLISCV